MNPARLALCCAVSSLLAVAPAWAGPGGLDFTFGIGGKVITPDANKVAQSGGMALQSDGKILVVGESEGEYIDRSFVLLRYRADGALDSEFGSGGRVFTDFPDTSDHSYLVAVQADGKILVAGFSVPINGEQILIALVRYQPDGSLDASFGVGGRVTTDITAGSTDGARGVAVQSDGKILVAGYTYASVEEGEFALVRYHADGSLDTSFGTGGQVVTSIGPGTNDNCTGMALQSDGKIVLGGQSQKAGNNDLALVRYTSSGALDASFGAGGKVITDFGDTEYGGGVVVQADGKIIMSGTASNPPFTFALARYHPNGNLDAGFGNAGRVSLGFGGVGRGVALQGDGKILVAGEVAFAGIGVARYHTDGTLDRGFGPDLRGGVFTRFASGPDTDSVATSVAVQGDGKIVVAGYGRGRGYGQFALARYFAGEPVPRVGGPVFDSETTTPAGTDFRGFGTPAVDGGQIGGLATVVGVDGGNELAAYGGADGAVLVQRGALDPEGSTFTALGDPVFGGGAVGFAGTARMAPASALRSFPMDARLGLERLMTARPGGRLGALYSRFSAAAGLKRLAVQTGAAPGTDGQFAKFAGFGLPRDRGGLIFTAKLHRGGTVNRRNDFGIWREKLGGGESELLLRTGSVLAASAAPASALRVRGAGGGSRTVEKLSLMAPVANATDQRRSFAPDGSLAAVADFDDETEGVIFVAADGSIDVPVDSHTPVPDEAGTPVDGIEFTAFSQPATASGGQFALAAALRAARAGVPPPPSSAIFANRDGSLRRVLAHKDPVPGREGVRFAAVGQPLLGQRGLIAALTSLSGHRVQPQSRKAIVLVENKMRAVAARLGESAAGFPEGAMYRRFISLAVTDSDPARLVFTGTVSGPGVTAANNLGLWSVSTASGVDLLLRTGEEMLVPVDFGALLLKVRLFDSLKAPRKSVGQGRSADADGFVTARATFSDGRKGVLRIPLP